jgi:hypothetical protein
MPRTIVFCSGISSSVSKSDGHPQFSPTRDAKPMTNHPHGQSRAQEPAATSAQTAAVTRAKDVADIAALTAKLAGVDVTVIPGPEVVIQVGSPPQPIQCLSVQFEQE